MRRRAILKSIPLPWKPFAVEASRYARLEAPGRRALEIEMLLR
jgi:hypothetical protein